ncbi:cadherin-like beta sandwich domain-containing protein [Polaribacter sp. SA4-10]|uniref:cadherin-like beta sandwich domain-containing protein n=1 Tax=Polaribacter sp. SA4-10 TaxID=754397 RepID=UPI0018DF6607|nr:cadherin-like beta sandwich domain-containing protein [Polaribacter sp. SA4-10]
MKFILLKKSFKRLICVGIIFFLSVVSAQAQTGLVGYWNFDEGTGTTVTDISGNGFDGVFNVDNGSLTWGTSSAFMGAGNALNFQGSYVQVTDNALFNDLQVNMTIEAWYYQTDNLNNTIISRQSYNDFIFQGNGTDANVPSVISLYSPDSDGWSKSSTDLPLNVWVHVAVTWNGATKTLKIYQNGALTDEKVLLNSKEFKGGDLLIGAQNGGNLMNGKLDEIRLWRVVRTTAEISENYNKTIAIADEVSMVGLDNLANTAGAYTQVFESGIIEYTIPDVNNARSSITVTPTKSDTNATIQVRVNAGSYADVDSGTESDPLALIVGANTVDVKVTAPDGITLRIYTITVTREIAYPSYVVSGAGTAAVNGVYTYVGKNSYGFGVWQYGFYYLSSDTYDAWIGDSAENNYSYQYQASAYNEPDPLKWSMSSFYGSSPNPVIELAGSKVTYASSTFIENSANNGAVTATTTITHNNYESAAFTGTDGEDFVTSGKAVVTGVPSGLTAVIARDNNLQLTFSLTGNASAHTNTNDISNLTIIFQDAAFSDSDAPNTTNFSANLSINFVEVLNVGSSETYTTIQSAVNAAGNGDVLLLAAETFTEQNIAIANKSLTIIGVSPASTIVQAHAVAGSATDRVFNITNDTYAVTNFHSFERLTIKHGNSANKGGGLYAVHTTLRLKDCAIETNTTTHPGPIIYDLGGGGVHAEKSNLISENCTFYNNHYASIDNPYGSGGGAIAFIPDVQNGSESFMDITNCTFSDNVSDTFGGAIFNTPTDTKSIRITNSTFAGNSAKQGGALSEMGWGYNFQPTYITNCLFYGNTASSDGSTLHTQYTTSWEVTNCLIESTTDGGQLNGVYNADCIVGVDPLLGTLTDNGGFTKTYSIGAGSPAINSGTTTSLPLDQRGFSIVGTRDIGAYEYGGTVPSTTSNNADLSALTTTAGAITPVFASETTSYTASVSNATTSITVTPTQSDANATISVNGTTVVSGAVSGDLALVVGSNTITTVVTAQDASTKTYTLTVTREKLDTTITNFNDVTKFYFDGSYTITAPTSDSPVEFIYTSGNTAVATIDGTTVTIIGAGNSTITATQAGNVNYNSGSITSVLTITAVSVLSKNGEISTTNPNYVNKNGGIGKDIALSRNGAILAVKTPAFIGEIRDGGVVFWLDPSDNTHGLVCAFEDYESIVVWGCSDTDLQNVINVPASSDPLGLGAEIGDGESNTSNILIDCPTAPAALAARSLGADWFLPSINAIKEMYVNREILEDVIGFTTFGNKTYWSSTEVKTGEAWFLNFFSGIKYNIGKTNATHIRAVRAF